MTTTISFADWVDWLAIEITFTELYESAPASLKHEMTGTLRRLAEGTSEVELGGLTSRVPNFERALGSFSSEEQSRFTPQLAAAVTDFAHHLAAECGQRESYRRGR